jgi:hypothetical protein
LPQTPESDFDRAIRLYKTGLVNQAIPIYLKSLMANPGLIEKSDGNLLDEARNFYEKRLIKNPDDIKSLFILAWIWDDYYII